MILTRLMIDSITVSSYHSHWTHTLVCVLWGDSMHVPKTLVMHVTSILKRLS